MFRNELCFASIVLLTSFAFGRLPTAEAVEFSLENPEIHLVDELENRLFAVQTGMIMTRPAPEGKRYLCIRVDVVGKDWEPGKNVASPKGKDHFRLRVGEKNYSPIGKLYTAGRATTLLEPRVTLRRPHRGDKQSRARTGVIFEVPADFESGDLFVGETAKLEISAADAKPLGSPKDYADFRVVQTEFIKPFEGTRYGTIAPAHGKLLAVTTEITARKTNSYEGRSFELPTQFMSLETAGSFTPAAGWRAENGNYSRQVTHIFEVGKTKSLTFLFVVADDFQAGNLRYFGDKVAEFTMKD